MRRQHAGDHPGGERGHHAEEQHRPADGDGVGPGHGLAPDALEDGDDAVGQGGAQDGRR